MSSFKSKKLRREAGEGLHANSCQTGTCGRSGDMKGWKQQESVREVRGVVLDTVRFFVPLVEELPQQRAVGNRRCGC